MLLVSEGEHLSYQTEDLTLALDGAGTNCFVSHAHSDHVPALRRSETLICSQETLELMAARNMMSKARESHHEKFEKGGTRIFLHDSGHILGSRQILIESDRERFVYTADFKTEDSLLFSGAKPVPCDTLLVESTYGLPKFSFPSREEAYSEISLWTKERMAHGSVVFGGYALGKAQELIRIINERVGAVPLVTDDVAEVCDVYRRHGIKLDYVRASSDEGAAALGRAFVAVLPQHKVTAALSSTLSTQNGRRVYTAVATGWASNPSWGFDVDRAFCLSDHCDFAELVAYVQATGAKKIYVNHGYSREFAAYLRKSGCHAAAVGDIATLKGQKKLFA